MGIFLNGASATIKLDITFSPKSGKGGPPGPCMRWCKTSLEFFQAYDNLLQRFCHVQDCIYENLSRMLGERPLASNIKT